MRRRDYRGLMADVQRLRPLAAVSLALIAVVPSLDEMLSQGLSPLTVLSRLVFALAVLGGLVWIVSGVVLHYARMQAESQTSRATTTKPLT